MGRGVEEEEEEEVEDDEFALADMNTYFPSNPINVNSRSSMSNCSCNSE